MRREEALDGFWLNDATRSLAETDRDCCWAGWSWGEGVWEAMFCREARGLMPAAIWLELNLSKFKRSLDLLSPGAGVRLGLMTAEWC